MNYIVRQAQTALERLSKSFSVILVTGARQTGKSTLLQNALTDLLPEKPAYITFDDTVETASAKADPKAYLAYNKPPLVLDEIQYAPELLPYIKIQGDAQKEKGRYFLSGSQQFHLMHNVTESLAGRVGIIQLHGISLRERRAQVFCKPFLPTDDYFAERGVPVFSAPEIWQYIFEGSFPAVVTKQVAPHDFYFEYLRTYIERDVRSLSQIGDHMQFVNFVRIVAARTAQLVNYRDMAAETGISEPTAKKWLSILVAGGLVYLLPPWHTNVEKRAVKTPKLYFMDTGLACYLTRWSNADVLQNGAAAGPLFETFVVAEIIKSYTNAALEPPLYFYRDKDKKEIDLIIEKDGILYPVEIKKTMSPNKYDLASFSIFERASRLPVGSGGVICLADKINFIAPHRLVIPLGFI